MPRPIDVPAVLWTVTRVASEYDRGAPPIGPTSVIEAYRRALISQFQPAMLLLAIHPVVVAALFWSLPWAVLTHVLRFVPVIGFLIPLFPLSRLNARVLRYDALAEPADASESRQLVVAPGLRWNWLGLLGSLMNVVPFLWFFSITLTGLAFIHAALEALNAKR